MNDITTIYFERNYLKIFDRLYAQVSYQEELFNGFKLYTDLSFENRKPLLNATDHVIIDNEDQIYTSNNPLQPYDFNSVPFLEHNIVKMSVMGVMNFGQEFMTYPDGKFNITSDKYPILAVKFEKGLGATIEDYNFDHLSAMVTQTLSPGVIGEFRYQVSGGTFFENEKISFWRITFVMARLSKDEGHYYE